MVYVCLAEALVLMVTISAFCGLLRSKERACARREDLMLDKVLHSVGRPWTPAPADSFGVDLEVEPATWSWNPEQKPVDEYYDPGYEAVSA